MTNKIAVMKGGSKDGVTWEVPLGINMVRFEHIPGPKDPGPQREPEVYYSTGVESDGERQVFELYE